MVGPGAVLTHYAFGNQKSCHLKRLPPAKFTELLNDKSEKNNCLDFDKCINSQEKKVWKKSIFFSGVAVNWFAGVWSWQSIAAVYMIL